MDCAGGLCARADSVAKFSKFSRAIAGIRNLMCLAAMWAGGAVWARSVGFPWRLVRTARKDNWEATSRLTDRET